MGHKIDMMNSPRYLFFITTLFVLSFLHGRIVNGKMCMQPDFRIYCGYCEGKPTVKETLACSQKCSATRWKAANEEFDQCIREGGTPGLSDDMQKEIQKVLPGFQLPIAPDIKVPFKEFPLKQSPKEILEKTQKASAQESSNKVEYAEQEKLVVKNLKYGQDIKEGDIITGEKGIKTIIHMPGGSIIDVREGGQITFEAENSFKTIKGFFKFLVIKANERSKKFTVRTNVAVAAVRGTEFLVEANESKTTLTVLRGTVEVSDLAMKKTVQVNEGDQTVVEKDKLPSEPKPFDPKSIDRWYEVSSEVSPEPRGRGKSFYFFIVPFTIFIPFIIFLLRNRLKKSP